MTFLQATYHTWSGHMTFGQFLNDKWGDVIGISILIGGIVIYRTNDVLGMMLIGSGLTALKLKTSGNGIVPDGQQKS